MIVDLFNPWGPALSILASKIPPVAKDPPEIRVMVDGTEQPRMSAMILAELRGMMWNPKTGRLVAPAAAGAVSRLTLRERRTPTAIVGPFAYLVQDAVARPGEYGRELNSLRAHAAAFEEAAQREVEQEFPDDP